MTEAAALEIVGLDKRFGALRVTSDVSLRLPVGARTALIGPNGAGKTTLVHLLSGVLRPDAGTIRLFGKDVTAASPAHRTRAGMVRTFQVTSLFARLTVLENVFIALSERHRTSFRLWSLAGRRRDLLDRAGKLLRELKLEEDAHRQVEQLAYGRQRMVEIAIALALEPRVLLLDEPAAGVPSAEIDLLLRAIDALPRDIAVLMIEHDMEMVRRFATEVVVLVAGEVLTQGTPQVVMSHADVRRVYLGQAGQRRFEGAVAHA
ncbi:MAG TPA: ABC transporter ATP-binding protein [Burkholderiaceae bacterium]|nr:ABC transporter ATP-binding protein [Burkholderiaceae bacterium]